MSDEVAHLPAWVRRRDGSQVPFDADHICQALFAAASSLGAASAFVNRELTDVVLHFLAQEAWPTVPTAGEISDLVEKIVREVGHPELARRYAQMQAAASESATKEDPGLTKATPIGRYLANCLESYAHQIVYSPDVSAAAREGLVRLGGMDAPAALASLVLETLKLAELPWWLALEDWRALGGTSWLVDSPDWVCTVQRHPALTPHLCDTLLALPTLAQRCVELHLNVSEPPVWSRGYPARPLFAADDEDAAQQERSSFLDIFLERWKALQAPRIPAVAWHLHPDAFNAETSRRRLLGLIRLALQGKPVRFVFDRAPPPIALAEGFDRKCPGLLLEVGLDLPALMRCAPAVGDGSALLKSLPGLARIAASAAQQKRRYLRDLPADAAVKRSFVLERSSALVVPIGLDEVVQRITGASLWRSPLSLDFARQILQTLKKTLCQSGRAAQLDLRMACPGECPTHSDRELPPRRQLEIAGKLHTCVDGGMMNLELPDSDPDAIAELLEWAWSSTQVAYVQLQRAGIALRQGELPI
ncbi:MAG: hypothetical protein HYX68_08730 [Planctomycetes bacterium]|nr:hypothetical protein [Planctomycetota bacterium]